MSPDPAAKRRLSDFCHRWEVAELWMFGSVARGEQAPESDVDLLVRFAPAAKTSTWDWPAMTDELAAIFGRRVDLLSEGVLRNPFRREAIMRDREILYAA